MPNYGNLNNHFDHDELFVKPNGWKELIIEYAYIEENDVLYLHWKVKSTVHIFTIQVQQLNKLDSTLHDHFKFVLEQFREDYIKWMNDGFKHRWQRDYKMMFENFITFKM